MVLLQLACSSCVLDSVVDEMDGVMVVASHAEVAPSHMEGGGALHGGDDLPDAQHLEAASLFLLVVLANFCHITDLN